MPRRPDNLETLHLSLELLKRIPRQRKIDSRELQIQLKEAGFERDMRTIQRQLESLCQHFDIERDDTSRPFGYRWKEAAPGLSLPGLTEQESLLMTLAEQHLQHQLPASLMRSLQGFFEQARRNLSPMHAGEAVALARQWLSKVRVVSTTLPMLPPKIKPEVFEQVSQALYNNCWLEISYTNALRKRTQAKVMPLGLAQQGVRMFMPCRFEGYADTRNLALHRIQTAQCSNLRFQRPADFDLQSYDDNGRFAFGTGNKIAIHLWVKDELAVLLAESPLATNQVIAPHTGPNGGSELKATLTDSALLVWWIRSQGDGVQVLGPNELMDDIKATKLA
ncbi:MAG: WYL domain-containing protein [Rhodoferax sp.]|nr:WYL domain-containing protein [Rhodoferax sp.]